MGARPEAQLDAVAIRDIPLLVFPPLLPLHAMKTLPSSAHLMLPLLNFVETIAFHQSTV
jgi:hypothetical protein